MVSASKNQITRFVRIGDSAWKTAVGLKRRAYYLHSSQNFMCVQVLQQLDAAQGSVEDMDEWLGIFNVKLRHMREDIESVYILS